MRQWLTRQSGNFARLASVLISCLLLLIIGYAGWAVTPHGGAGGPGRLYQEVGAAPAGAPLSLPVFLMRANHSVVRHGTAIVGADGQVRVSIFASAAAEQPQATEALLFEPSIAVLWAAATDGSRAELKQRLSSVQDQGGHAVEQLITSEVFTEVYRPALRAILTDAVSHAWRDIKTQSAFAELIVNADRSFKQKARQGIEAIIVSRVKEAVWDMLQANWLNAFAVPLGYDLDYTPLMRAVSATFVDPRIQQSLMEFGSEQLDTDEARHLAERVAIGGIEALMRDRRVPDVASAMVWDPRLRETVRPLTEAVMALGAAVPRNLGGLGATSGLNPLAAHVFKAILLGRNAPLILLVTPEERTRIERLEPDAAKVLRPVKAGNAT